MTDDSIILDPLPDYAGVYRNLLCVGLLGTIYSQSEDVNIVCSVVETTLEQPELFRIYRAVISGLSGRSDYARETLERHIEKFPDDDIAKVSLGAALMLSGERDWKHWIDAVLATSINPTTRTAASGVLSFLRTNSS